MVQFIIAVIVLYLYYLAVRWFFNVAAGPVFIFASIAYIILILVNYFRAVIDCFSGKLASSASEVTIPPEPAFKNYFFRKAYLDYVDIVKQAWEYNIEHSKILWQKNVELLFNGLWFLTWPLAITLFSVFFVAAATGLASFIAFGLFHMAIVSIICVGAYIIALFFRTIERFSMVWRRISYVCPHSECYQHIALPMYTCPACGSLHKRLIPGSYGIFRRRCQCNSALLPTLSLWGRRKVAAQCPHCNRPLSQDIGSARNIHLPIVGGASTGKTNFLMASVIEIENDSKLNGREMSFPVAADERTFDVNKTLFNQGRPVSKTTTLSPESFLLKIAEPNGDEHLIYIYDAAGELYADSGDLRRRQKYFGYTDGILFLIDPFSITQVKIDYDYKIREIKAELGPSKEEPQDVYDRMITTLKDLFAKKRLTKNIPIAVVLTKIDAFDLMEKVGLVSTSGRMMHAFDQSTAVREWILKSGGGNLVRSIEKDFKNVQYFCSSALGHMPENNKPFKSFWILPPVQWLLKHRAVAVSGKAETGLSFRSEKIAYTIAIVLTTMLFTFSGYFITQLTKMIMYQIRGSQSSSTYIPSSQQPANKHVPSNEGTAQPTYVPPSPSPWSIEPRNLFSSGGQPINPDIAKLVAALESSEAEGTPVTRQEFIDMLSRPESKTVYRNEIIKYATPASLAIQKKEHEDYTKIFMKEHYQKAGLDFLRDQREYLERAEQKYGVLKRDIVSVLIWESGLGKFTGDYQEFNVFLGQILFLDLAQKTAVDQMVAEGKVNPLSDPARAQKERARLEKRKNSAIANMATLLRVCRKTGLDPFSMKGSMGGAIGSVQFMPVNLKYAVDGDADGKVNLSQWPDAIMSVANYLRTLGKYDATDAGRNRAILRYNPSKEYA
ncbi:MAG TPA: lytic murein transglycosylase, partial [bacterium]|nr:lytic murein transglycosylase [bacterium]